MQCIIGLGSNLGERRNNLEAAARAIAAHPAASNLHGGSIFSTPALLPPNAPADWNIPYLNSVLQLEWNDTPQALLQSLKAIETALGRSPSARWAPRLIDLDILLFGNESILQPDLQIPHIGLTERSFVLDPLLHLSARRQLSNGEFILPLARDLPSHSPLWMGILNLTPDSFSDGGTLSTTALLETRIRTYEEAGVQCFDLGAESTRPGALPLTAGDEWQRLEPALSLLHNRYKNIYFHPLISVDTYRAAVASKALALGAHIINDVSGLADPAMIATLKMSDCHYVLMHSLSIPASSTHVLSAEQDPVQTVYDWALQKIELLTKNGITLDRIIFDPGIGFGKTPQQSLQLLQNCQKFYDLPVRLLIGHSRKSFMSLWSQRAATARDPDSIGASLRLAQKGVDILRVHAADHHVQAWQAFQLID
jgi:2-amino-4-hydroxy-6-hydroxymethyldihydropteridine diphosphokinase/dihydropteroate synthase